ncbi:MAG: hypothetical protein BGO98_06670 [Myxococcales bacterium 68-20]|nr:MAG: hypothetical protein BGO98_06670 [Myxococcales bacterium 68-20]
MATADSKTTQQPERAQEGEVDLTERARRTSRRNRPPRGKKTPDAPLHGEALRALADAWLFAVRGPRRHAVAAAAVLLATIAMLVARGGTAQARLSGALILAVTVLGVVVVRLLERRVFASPARTIEHVAGRMEPEAAARAIRALSLLEPVATRGASRDLAELHVARSLAALPLDGVRRGAQRVAFVLGVVALGLAAVNVAACAMNPWAAAEGADVLVARGGVAPVGMTWLSEPQIRARPPDYLHLEERRVMPYDDVALPRGTLLTVRGAPIHAGRRLLLTDGSAEVPFVDDGSGHVVARWPLADSVNLRVVARFGNVVIPEPEATPVESIPDLPPLVRLEGAPKQIRLASEEDTSEIPIHYDAMDDHGLREVHLVLRAGPREERRVLARLDGETKTDRGGYNLRASDAFIKKSHAPIEVRVEAKDNDPITGPKWGASDAITIVPPDVGEPQSRRLAGLVRVRDELVDALAWRLRTPLPAEPKERRAMLERDVKLADEGSEALETALTTSYAGVRVSSRLGAMLRGRMRKVKDAANNQLRSPSTSARANVVKATERMVLVIDAAIQGLGLRDTRGVARELAEVAEELAAAAALAHKPAEKVRGEQRMDAAVIVLDGGGKAMRRLGALGRDIGEIVEMDLLRVARARGASDLTHAVLAAQDLAARLRQPDPSFGARGGRPSQAGGESGGGRGAPGAEDDGEASDVEEAFNEAARELDKLAAEHAGHVGRVEQALAAGSTKEDVDALSEEAKKHAQKIREAVRPLPNVGGGSDSWTSKGAAAREHAEQMAKSMEQGNAADAVQSGRNALGALDEAKRAASRERFGRFGDPNAERTVDDARRQMEAEVKWAEDKLEELRRRAAQRAAPELREHADTEGKLGERARELANKGRDQEALPAPALDALRDAEEAAQEAAKALRGGDADRGLAKQREAQQKLEMARDALGEGEGERDGESGDGDRAARDHADIPKADAHKGPEEFRKRVIKGLGQPSSGKYKDAVKRYAEGLLR